MADRKEAENLIKNYFEYWNDQDLHGLRLVVNEDIELEDWEINARGINEFIQANKKIFEQNPDIAVHVERLLYGEKVIIAQIDIEVEGKALKVVDCFNLENNKIKKITAYRCF